MYRVPLALILIFCFGIRLYRLKSGVLTKYISPSLRKWLKEQGRLKGVSRPRRPCHMTCPPLGKRYGVRILIFGDNTFVEIF
jgi:hypothetical protein